MLKNRNTNFY